MPFPYLVGAAPIRVDTVEYFGSLGIDINEVCSFLLKWCNQEFCQHEARGWAESTPAHVAFRSTACPNVVGLAPCPIVRRALSHLATGPHVMSPTFRVVRAATQIISRAMHREGTVIRITLGLVTCDP
eukprot:598507-Amphidinium_carterae.1